eukprot:TRINITY_DN4674_c0_g1_i1.p2 TRINITY_DN4674_c0_g1~~TRINITY_DN4674_c0_g1_i1.p2  ORF type:complete len:312 (-),score=91.64 TRINITY_DN4674_c0_g1_i1:97-1032(-)
MEKDLENHINQQLDPNQTQPGPRQSQKLPPHLQKAKLIQELKTLVQSLPSVNRTNLSLLFYHLSHVVSHQKSNKMNSAALAIVFFPKFHRMAEIMIDSSEEVFGKDPKVFGVPLLKSIQRKSSNTTINPTTTTTSSITITTSTTTTSITTSPSSILPLPLAKGFEWIEKFGMNEVGVYRVPGDYARVLQYVERFDLGEEVEIPANESPFTVASLLVQFFQMVPEPLFGFNLKIKDVNGDPTLFLAAVKNYLAGLPSARKEVLREIIFHLKKLSINAERNHMDVKNLNICVGGYFNYALDFLIPNYESIFLS